MCECRNNEHNRRKSRRGALEQRYGNANNSRQGEENSESRPETLEERDSNEEIGEQDKVTSHQLTDKNIVTNLAEGNVNAISQTVNAYAKEMGTNPLMYRNESGLEKGQDWDESMDESVENLGHLISGDEKYSLKGEDDAFKDAGNEVTKSIVLKRVLRDLETGKFEDTLVDRQESELKGIAYSVKTINKEYPHDIAQQFNANSHGFLRDKRKSFDLEQYENQDQYPSQGNNYASSRGNVYPTDDSIGKPEDRAYSTSQENSNQEKTVDLNELQNQEYLRRYQSYYTNRTQLQLQLQQRNQPKNLYAQGNGQYPKISEDNHQPQKEKHYHDKQQYFGQSGPQSNPLYQDTRNPFNQESRKPYNHDEKLFNQNSQNAYNRGGEKPFSQRGENPYNEKREKSYNQEIQQRRGDAANFETDPTSLYGQEPGLSGSNSSDDPDHG